MPESAPRRIVREDGRDLGEREDEDEVEEQLERCDSLLALGALLAHSGTLTRRAGGRQRSLSPACTIASGQRA